MAPQVMPMVRVISGLRRPPGKANTSGSATSRCNKGRTNIARQDECQLTADRLLVLTHGLKQLVRAGQVAVDLRAG